jgi:hypothetical protein
MLQWLYMYVASVYSKCFIYFRRMLQVFLSECYICCSGYTYVAGLCSKCFICFRRMLQEVLSCCKCFMSRHRRSPQANAVPVCAIRMLQKYLWMSHMLQWLYTCVASIYSKCFIYFRHMLQVLLFGCCICCSGYTHTLQAYVPNISFALDVCYRKCFHVASAS